MQHEDMLETPIEQENTDINKPTADFKAPTNEPEDKGNLVYWIFMFYGFTVLLSWNAVINSFDYMILSVSRHFNN